MMEIESLRDVAGFASVTVSSADSSVTLYWKGTVPDAVTDVHSFAELRGVSFTTAPAAYSAVDVADAAEEVKREVEQGGTPVYAIGFAPDSSGLRVEFAEQTAAGRRARSSMKMSLTSASDVPIVFRMGGPALERDRNDMESPFKGGGVLSFPQGFCTSGFAVTIGGVGHLLSAGHCAPQGNPNWIRNGNETQTITNDAGDVDVADAYDSLLIDPDPSPATIGNVFHGGLNTNNKLSVSGKAAPSVGEAVCISGANTGGHCNATIYEITQFRCGAGANDYWCDGFRVRSTNGEIIGGAGDSGAPVYVERSDGKVGARGIYVSGVGGYQAACGTMRHGDATDPGNCDTRINVVGINPLLDRWNASIETN